mgnify:CR=1 FL=1
MTKNIPYKYYKTVLLGVWALAVLCIVGTWICFTIQNQAALAFGLIVDIFLTLAVAAIVTLLFLNGREDYKKRGWIFAAFGVAHLLFFILVVVLRSKIVEGNTGVYALPAIHTVILIAISVVGIYFWIRNKFTFKSFAQQDAAAAFGGPIDEPKIPETPVQPEEPKKARDEKTGIVSL